MKRKQQSPERTPQQAYALLYRFDGGENGYLKIPSGIRRDEIKLNASEVQVVGRKEDATPFYSFIADDVVSFLHRELPAPAGVIQH